MKNYIKSLALLLNNHPNLKQWGWFIFLWVAGMLSFIVAAYPIKLLIKAIG